MNENYNLLIDNLDAFIRKYYANQLIRGILYSIALLGSFFIVFTQLESFAWFSVNIRTILFYLYLVGGLVFIARFVFWPILNLYKAGKRITHEMAAVIIGTHFSDVRDTLLNTLQLNSLSADNQAEKELIQASINQKAEKLKIVPFRAAIDLTKNRKYLMYALPPILILSLFLIFSPQAITGPGTRLIHHTKNFEKPLPFRLHITNKELKAVQQEDFTINLKIEGDEIPDQVFINIDEIQYRMEAEDRLNYSFTFKKVQKNQKFNFVAAGYNTIDYELIVLPKPIILNFETELVFPKYTNQKTEIISNTGDFSVPQGTTVNWKFYTRDTRFLSMKSGDKLQRYEIKNSNTVNISKRLMVPTPYSVAIENQYMKGNDSMSFFINIIPDLFPNISVDEYRDSVYDNRLYFRGLIKDDYGFRILEFRLSRLTDEGENSAERSVTVNIDNLKLQQQFYHYFDLVEAGLQPGDKIEYYFIVWDNDGVNGSKSSKSQTMSLKIPTLKEIEDMVSKNTENVKSELKKNIEEAKKIQKDISQLNKRLQDKKSLNYQEKKQVEDILERQRAIQQQIELMKLSNDKAIQKESQYKEANEIILEKQRELQKLFDELMSDEMKQLFEELQKMMDNLDKEKLNEVLDKLKFNAEDLEKALDRDLELFKQLEFDKKLSETIEKLKDISKQQDKLSEKTQDSDKNNQDQLTKEQQKINEDFNTIKENLQDLKEINKKLEEPNNFNIPEQKKDDIQKDLDDSEKNIKENQLKKASKSQKDASDKMEEMSDMLFEMQQEMDEESLEEDIEALRAILENLVQISFDQEELINELATVNRNDPRYSAILDHQKGIKDNLVMVEDSLYALSKRQTMIESFVIREIASINDNVEEAMKALNNRVIPSARGKQQFVMTSVNNLALMLSESMKQMQQNMSISSKSGKSGKSCPNPGSGKPSSMKSMRQMQEKLNQQMEAMKKSMKEGKGEKGKTGSGSMSEQLARMTAQQQALRKQLQEYRDQLQKEGAVNQQGLNKMIEEMEKTETEMVNKILNEQTMKRQEEILTRMLESEKAEMQREEEERRESKQGQDVPKPDPATYFNHLGIPSRETELLRTVPPSLRLYYKNKVNEYFINLPSTK